MGDLSENADYHKAKEDQGFMEGRIQELGSHPQVALKLSKPAKPITEVTLGARVTIQEADYPPETYHLVGSNEANPREGRISHESPIGKALIGHKAGDTVEANLPNGGTIVLEILKIE